MHFLGIDVEEWAALVAVLVGIGGFISWLFKMSVKSMIDQLIYQFENLSDNIKNLTQSSEKNRAIEESHFQEHERRLAKHDVDIESLRDRIGNSEDDIQDLKEENEKK